MSSPAAQNQWYLARDGQQYGPLSEVELVKFIELGHLEPNDLVWREGFPDWRPALTVFPPRRAPAHRQPPPHFSGAGSPGDRQPVPSASRSPQGQPSHYGDVSRSRNADEDNPELDEAQPRRGGALRKVAALVLCLGAIGAIGWYAYPNPGALIDLMKSLPSRVPTGLFGAADPASTADRRNIETSPLKGLVGGTAEIDAALQATPLWRTVKREFSDWYDARVNEAATLASQNNEEAAIAQHMARALVVLRRQNAKHALAASFPHLKAVASSFHKNLDRLRKHSSQACYDFISKGEASPMVISLMQSPGHAAYLQAQLTDVFEAIADGRKAPRVYPQPRKADYDLLAADLTKRGWSQGDLRLFSDERALSTAGSEKVCQLVHDWFAAQLSISDPDVQLRLLVDSLRPVVAG